MNRIEKHLVPRRRIVNQLREAGFEVTQVASQRGYDLLVNGQLRVALRVSFPRYRSHTVTARGRRYVYRYRSWHFNFHHHGKINDKYTDVFVCVGLESHRRSEQAVFVIPWEAVTGKTFSLLAGQKPYAGRYARYRDNWATISELLAERNERDPARETSLAEVA
ncbi:MAG TPA: hypothetical protein VEB21_00155 [Terriglobales bacterium]|nr:hypothetical protein [Terriglobales bacterium]